jgi:hypothetical protein
MANEDNLMCVAASVERAAYDVGAGDVLVLDDRQHDVLSVTVAENEVEGFVRIHHTGGELYVALTDTVSVLAGGT